MNKRGLLQIDWIISIAVFLLFIAVFMIMIAPSFSPDQDLNPVLDILKTNFESEQITILNYPITAKNNFSQSSPIVVNFEDQNPLQLTFKDNRSFIIQNNKLFFYGLSETNLIKSKSTAITYIQRNESFDIISKNLSTQIPTNNFEANYVNSLLDNITYRSIIRAFNFNYPFSNSPVFVNTTFLSTYISSDHESYIFANFSRIFNYNYVPFTLEFNLWPYSNVYFQGNNISIDYTSTGCTAFNTKSIDFFNLTNPNGLAIFSLDNYNSQNIQYDQSQNLTGYFCRDSSKNLNISFTTQNYAISLHDGDYLQAYDAISSSYVSLPEETSGFLLSQLQTFDYNTKKSDWGIPNIYNYKILIANSTITSNTIFILGKDLSAADIFASETNAYLINHYGNKQAVKINYLLG